jgi:hypothetical protein
MPQVRLLVQAILTVGAIALTSGCQTDGSPSSPSTQGFDGNSPLAAARLHVDSIVVAGATITHHAVRLRDGRVLSLDVEAQRVVASVLAVADERLPLESRLQRRLEVARIKDRLDADPALRQRARRLAAQARSSALEVHVPGSRIAAQTTVPIADDCLVILGAIYYTTQEWHHQRSQLGWEIGTTVTSAIVDAIYEGTSFITFGITASVPAIARTVEIKQLEVTLDVLATFAHLFDCVE